MEEIQQALKNSSLSFSSLAVDGKSLSVSGEDYNELHQFLEHIREKYSGKFIIRFTEPEDESKFRVKLTTIDITEFCTRINYERLLRAILEGRKNTFDSYK